MQSHVILHWLFYGKVYCKTQGRCLAIMVYKSRSVLWKKTQILEFFITSVLLIIAHTTPDNKAHYLPNKIYFDLN